MDMASGGTAPRDALMRGELFKAGKDGGNFKLRWFELNKKGELNWAEGESAPLKGSQPLRDCQIVIDKSERVAVAKGVTETRFGFSIYPPGVAMGRQHKLQASSLEERQLWVDALEKSAHPDAQRASLFNGGRIVVMKKSAGRRLGLELADSASLTGVGGAPCVTVTDVNDIAADAGLLPGDMVLMMGPTVLRNHSVALRCFANAVGEMTLRLALLTREVRVTKRSGMAGIQFSTPPSGPGVLVSSLQPEGAGAAAGLHPGDRVLSVAGKVCTQGGLHAMELAKEDKGGVLKLVVCGVSHAVPIRKDADGRLGLQFVEGTPSGSVQGAVIASVLPRSAAREAGLRNGDLLVAVDEQLVSDVATARDCIGNAARGLTLVIWRPRADAAADEAGPSALASAASEGKIDGESQRGWYFSTDLQSGRSLPDGALLYGVPQHQGSNAPPPLLHLASGPACLPHAFAPRPAPHAEDLTRPPGQ